jgi:hypothetical protein
MYGAVSSEGGWPKTLSAYAARFAA